MPLRNQPGGSPQWPRATQYHGRITEDDEPGQLRQRTPRRRTIEEPTDEDDDSLYDTRMPSSTRRYHTAVEKTLPRTMVRVTRQQGPPPIRRASLMSEASTQTQEHSPASQPARRMHWLFYAGFAVALVAGTQMVCTLIAGWWTTYQNDLHYGRPRTYQTDARVGHDDTDTPSHFIALNLHGHIEVIECPGADCTKAVVYVGPVLFGDGQDLAPTTLEFRDVNHDGKPDMIVHVQDQIWVFINDNGKFRPATPDDHVSV